MIEHTGGLWHYLGSFVMYTLMAVAMIYGAYWLIQRAPASAPPPQKPKEEEDKPGKLELESSLALDAQRTLHVIRTGSERFMLATVGESMQMLSRLENVPSEAPPPVEEPPPPPPPVEDLEPVAVEAPPWYAAIAAPAIAPPAPPPETGGKLKSGFADRLVRSVKWLAASRMGK